MLKLIKENVRSTMTIQTVLTYLMIMSCEKYKVDKIDIDNIVTKCMVFGQTKENNHLK